MYAEVNKTYNITGKITIQDLRDIEAECQVAFNCGDCCNETACAAIQALYGLRANKSEDHAEIKRVHNKTLRKK